jgi:DNA-binding response OmpR family regulator/chromosome segregation ATPase
MPTKVLVFESDVAFAGELRTELGHLGCSTTVVDDGNLGLQQAASDKPDLILLSIELPRMNGFSVCNKLKKDPNLKDVPLIIMSTDSSDETFEQHKKLRTRAEDYVHKPVAFGELLQHIQGFISLAAAPVEGDGAIVIDDEIEVGTTDYVLEDDDDDSETAVVSAAVVAGALARKPEAVDADVDAFAESAFGRLTGPDAPTPAIEARAMRNGSVAPPEALRSSIPPAARPLSVRQSSTPPGGVTAAEHERVREELARANERVAATEREIDDARQEIGKLRIEVGEGERLEREIEELKARLAAGAKSGGISSREFLDLREGLNKKDKEILSLREHLSRKDKEIVESQDRALGLERAKADLDERLLGLEREIAETREKNEALSTDKDLAKKASDDFRTRLEKTKVESEAKDRQLADLRARHAAERSSADAKVASARAELDQVLANERATQAREMDEAESRRRADLMQAARERDAAVDETREQGDRSRREALSAQAEELRHDHEAALGALRKAQQDELERTRAAAAQQAREIEERLQAQIDAANKETNDLLAEVRADAERRELEALDALRAEHAEKITSLENDRDSRVAALEAKATRDLNEANNKLARLDMDASALRGELQSVRASKESGDAASAAKVAELEKKLSEVQGARDELAEKHAAASDRLGSVEAELGRLRDDFAQIKEKLERESSRADKAATKWEADKQALERAKDALAVALAQIEDTEARTL